MQTLTRERRQKFEAILSNFSDKLTRAEIEATAELLADASISRAERKTDEEAAEYNVELMRGDYNEYPEHVREIARVLRDVWLFALPPKPKGKKEKSRYSFFIMSMENIKHSCAEFGADVLIKLHADWRAGFKNGLAPYTIATPESLVNVASGKAREMRETIVQLPQQPKLKDGSGYV